MRRVWISLLVCMAWAVNCKEGKDRYRTQVPVTCNTNQPLACRKEIAAQGECRCYMNRYPLVSHCRQCRGYLVFGVNGEVCRLRDDEPDDLRPLRDGGMGDRYDQGRWACGGPVAWQRGHHPEACRDSRHRRQFPEACPEEAVRRVRHNR
jgi:hypothetical protein